MEERRVYRAVKVAIADILMMAREELFAVWKNLDKKEHYRIGRAQVFLKKIANRPQDYLSRASTEKVWMNKINAYQKQGGYKADDIKAVSRIVGSPADDVYSKVYPMFRHLKSSVSRQLLKDLFVLVQEWEYKRTAKDKAEVIKADNIAKKIFEMREKIESKKNSKRSKMAVWEIWKNAKRTFLH